MRLNGINFPILFAASSDVDEPRTRQLSTGPICIPEMYSVEDVLSTQGKI